MIDATPLLRAYARFRLGQLAREDAPAMQRAMLRKLLARAAATAFGRRHGFAAIRSVEEFQARVPLTDYDAFWRDHMAAAFPVLRDVSWPGLMPYFALTSGTTTGRSKYIPCSHAMVRANNRAGIDILVHHLANRPDSRVLAGPTFMLGGSTGLTEEAPGVRSGDLSGIAAAEVPRWARPLVFPPKTLALIADWEEKIARVAEASLRLDIRAISGTPSWLLLFFERLRALHPDRPPCAASYYPHLELVIHGGVNFAPYRQRFAAFLAGSPAETREVYAASEGFVAIADRGDGEGMRLLLDNGLFMEFVPVEELHSQRPTRHWIATAEPGVDYALVLTTCAGLFAFALGDVVRLVSRMPPRIVITGRTSTMLSAFGEHLIGAEIDQAVGEAASAIAATVTEFAVGPVFPVGTAAKGCHLFLVEFGEPLPDPRRLELFAHALDDRLSALNDDYRVHRAGDFGLDAPEVRAVKPGAFAKWMKARGRLGGQHKAPRVVTNPEALAALAQALAE
jgi:hypothetical protein